MAKASCLIVFRDQEIDIHQQLDLARHFGPLHKHATTPIPKCGLEEVHGMSCLLRRSWGCIEFSTVIYNDASRRPDPSAFSKLEMWHSDVSFSSISSSSYLRAIRSRMRSNLLAQLLWKSSLDLKPEEILFGHLGEWCVKQYHDYLPLRPSSAMPYTPPWAQVFRSISKAWLLFTALLLKQRGPEQLASLYAEKR